MVKRFAIRRKRRTREHVIADLGINYVERQVLLCGHTVEWRVHDYGIDLLMKTYDHNGEVENGEVLFQLKATDRPQVALAGQAITLRVERADLASWLGEPMPVILMVYDARADRAYWLYVQREFEKMSGFDPSRGSRTVTIRVPKSQLLDVAAVAQFARYRDHVLAQQKSLVRHE